MATKKFKSVAGYLRSCGKGLQYRDLPKDEDQRIAAVQAGQRDIVNNLMPQIGLTHRIEATEKPADGVERLLTMAGNTAQQTAALEACRRWLKNYVIIHLSVTAIPQVKTEEGLVSYHVYGFRRDNHKARVSMIVDEDGDDVMRRPFHIAGEIAGPEYCFHASSNLNVLVPDSAKGRLFTSDEELYAEVPQLRPHQTRRRATR